MRLIFIRHAEPDYENHSVTEKGFREIACLAKRVSGWKNVKAAYVSPLARAALTAEPCLAALGMQGTVYEWLREFWPRVKNPSLGNEEILWDMFPEYFTKVPEFYDKDHWVDAPLYAGKPEVRAAWKEVCEGIDGVLAQHGYHREENLYRMDRTVTDGDDDDSILFFCHFGISSVILGHLIGISPILMLHHFVSPPTGITIANAEKRDGDAAHFRIQCYGDAAHLRENGEALSQMAAFSPIFQG